MEIWVKQHEPELTQIFFGTYLSVRATQLMIYRSLREFTEMDRLGQ